MLVVSLIKAVVLEKKKNVTLKDGTKYADQCDLEKWNKIYARVTRNGGSQVCIYTSYTELK